MFPCRCTALIFGLLALFSPSAGVVLIKRLFDIDDTSCIARRDPKAPPHTDRLNAAGAPFSQALAMLDRVVVANTVLMRVSKQDPYANGLLNARMNAAHMTWGIRPPEAYADPGVGGAYMEPLGRARVAEADTRLKAVRTFLTGQPVAGRELQPEKASLACS